jgi:hypothetical protein
MTSIEEKYKPLTFEEATGLGANIAGELRGNSNATMRIILTQIEALLGETKQAESFKKLVKHEFYRLMDFNQHSVYINLNVEKQTVRLPMEPVDDLTMPPDDEQ